LHSRRAFQGLKELKLLRFDNSDEETSAAKEAGLLEARRECILTIISTSSSVSKKRLFHSQLRRVMPRFSIAFQGLKELKLLRFDNSDEETSAAKEAGLLEALDMLPELQRLEFIAELSKRSNFSSFRP
jgi:hypothetical protein